MGHQARGFEQYSLCIFHTFEKQVFLKTACVVFHRDIPEDADMINSDTSYMVKHDDSGSLKLKNRHCTSQ